MVQNKTKGISRNAFSVDPSAAQDGWIDSLTPAVQNLGERGEKLHRRGLKLAIATAVLAVVAVVVALTGMGLEPSSSFSSVELPTLKELAPQEQGTAPFAAMGMKRGLSVQHLQKYMNILAAVLVFLLLLLGAITGDIFRHFSAVIAFVVIAGMVNMTVAIEGNQSDDETSRYEMVYKRAQRLATEERFTELLALARQMMPDEKVTYLSAQVAYVQRDREATQAKLATLPAAERSVHAERVAIMENFAYGKLVSQETLKFERDSQASTDAAKRLRNVLGVIAIGWALVAATFIGLGHLIRRRAARLESMLRRLGEPADLRHSG